MRLNQDLPTLDEVVRECTLERLAYFKGHMTRTAKSLGISLKTLYLRLHRYGISVRDFRKKNVVKRAERSHGEAKRYEEARIRSQVSKAVFDLIAAPLAMVVPMGARDRRVMVKPTKSNSRKSRHPGSNKPMARWLELRL